MVCIINLAGFLALPEYNRIIYMFVFLNYNAFTSLDTKALDIIIRVRVLDSTFKRILLYDY